MNKIKKNKNPLNKRIMHDIIKEKGKYLSIFLFLTLMIGIVSGMLVNTFSMMKTYDEGIEKYKLEDGHFSTFSEVSVEYLQEIADKTEYNISVYKQHYYNIDYSFDGNSDYSIRIYENRDKINTYSIFEGREPSEKGDLAIDRLFAENNDLNIGDILTINSREFKICGLVAVPDYSCLFESNSESMFNASTFTVGFVSDSQFNELPSSKLIYSYAYIFNDKSMTDTECYDASNDFMTEISTNLAEDNNYLTDFLMRQLNKAITFTRKDMDGDTFFVVIILYILIALLAFIFTIITYSTIEKESGAIGTLRASGYKKSEIIRHYMTAPIIIFIAAAIIGNILGYTYFRIYMEQMYYHPYSLPVYKVFWNANAFLLTTIIPIAILIIISFISLYSKLKLSPLDFLRNDLGKKKRKKVKKLPNYTFFTRFRIRTIIQNMPNYITMGIGILFANILLFYSLSMLPIINKHTDNILDNLISKYQYTLNTPVETSNETAEKFCLTQLTNDSEQDILIYGISDNSKYITSTAMPVNKGDIIMSEAFMNLNNYKIGDSFTLFEEYGDKSYTFTIKDSYNYPAALSIFMSIDNYNAIFENNESYFTGYLCNEEITDIDEDMIYSTMTTNDYTKLSEQMTNSFSDMLPLINALSIIIFILVIYLLSKLVLEKNAKAISLTKILGYNNKELSKIYISSTTVAVVISVLLSIPLSALAMYTIFTYTFSQYDIWITVHINPMLYVEVVILDIVSYALLTILQYGKIKKIPMEEALKDRE